jgi:hypothetical protein
MAENSDQIKLYLSRSTYPINSSVIGTINVPEDIKLSSLQVYVAGRSRLDARWHDIRAIKNRYGSHPCHDALPSWVEQCAEESCFNKATNESVCFWSTNVMTLWKIDGDGDGDDDDSPGNGLQIPLIDNSQDEMEEDKPTPLMMSGSEWFNRASRYIEIMLGGEEQLESELGTESQSEYEESTRSDSDESDDGDEESSTCTRSSIDTGISSTRTGSRTGSRIDELGDEDGTTTKRTRTRSEDIQRNGGNDDDRENTDHDGQTEHEQEEREAEGQGQGQDEEIDHSKEKGFPLHFTFRANLSEDLVPTVNAVCARYFYSAVVYARTVEGKSIVVQTPFTVVTPSKSSTRTLIGNGNGNKTLNHGSTKTMISIGAIHGLAHTRPYLVPLSITYKAEPWSISVKRSQRTGTYDSSNIQSIAIEEGGYTCGTLKIIGGGLTTPGNTISLQFEFAKEESLNDAAANADSIAVSVLPCYQVSACLQGEEYAIGVHGNKKKCRSYVFDTDDEKIHPDATSSASLLLNVPAHCPITISTDFVEICITCRIDLTVKTPGSDSYRFLTVQFPCQVVQSAPEEEPTENGLSASLENKLLDLKWPAEKYPVQRSMFSSEVVNDLNMLSLHQLNKIQQSV